MRSWRIFAGKTTEFRLHPAVPIFFLYSALTGHLILVVVTTISILIHECAHAVTAFICGLPIRSIELTPIGAILKTGDTQKVACRKRFFILAAGPAGSWLICLLSLLLLKLNLFPNSCCRILLTTNFSLLMMNLLPAFPLDGGRMLALILELFLTQRRVHQIMRIIGTTAGFFLILLNIYCSMKLGGWNLSLALAGCCLIYGARAETTTWAMTELRCFLDRKIMLERKQHLPVSIRYVLSTVPVRSLIHTLPPRQMMLYCCIEPGSMKMLGFYTEMEVIQHYLQSPVSTLNQVPKMSQNCIHMSKYDTI